MSRRSQKYSGPWAALALTAVLLGLTPAFAAPPVVTLLSPADLASTVNPYMSLSADVSGTSPTTAKIYGGTSSPPTGFLFVRDGITTNQTLTYIWRDVMPGGDANTMGLWHLDNGTGVSATDASANGNTGTLQNGAAWTQSGRFAYALDLDGTNDYLSVPDAASLDISAGTGKISIELWVYPRVLAGGYRTLLGKFQSTSLINYQISMDATNHLLFYTPAGGIKTSAIVLPVNEWSYIAVTLDAADGIVRFYRNGVAGTPVSAGAFGAPNTGALYIGQNGNNTEWINGFIDDVRLSNRILTAAEIAANYGLANGTYYWQVKADDGINPPVESAIRSFTRAPDSDPPVITLNAPSDGAVTSDPYMTLDATVSDANPPMTVWIYGDTQSDPTTLLQVEENVANLSSVTFDWSASVLQTESPYTMGLWHADEGTGTTTADASGNGNGGTLLNGAAWTTAGRFGHALNLDGTDDYVSIPDNVNGSLDIDSLTGALTIEMWVRPDVLAGRFRTLLGKYASSSQINYQISVDATNHLLFYSGKYSHVPPDIWVSDVVLPVGEWSYIAVTMQATSGVGTVHFYRNGVEGTPMTGAFFAPANNGALVIGQNGANTTEFWDGLIDEVRLTRRVLGAAEIGSNYTLGDGTYHWKVTARDAVSNSVTSAIRDFTVGAGAPDIPVLLLPLDASLTTDNSPTFVWSSTAGEGGSYKLQYATSTDFSSGVVTTDGITDTTFTVASGQELANGTWTWHVQAVNASADSSGYQASAFQLVVNAPTELDPPAVTLLAPAQGATIVTDHALLSTSVSDASPPMTVYIYGDRSTDPTHLLEVEEGVADLATVSHDWSASALEPEAPYTMGLWHFDDGGGTTTSDESGNDNTGSFVGTPTWSAAGHLGYALDFGGVAQGDYVRIPDLPTLDVAAGTGALTIEAWVYPRSAGGGVYRSILGKRGFGSGAGPCNYQISLNNSNGNLLFYNGTAVFASSVSVPVGAWSHLAITLDATVGRLRFYRDGVLLDSASGVNFGPANDSALYIGVANVVTECFDGLIDEVRLTGRALSPAEMAAHRRLDPDTYYWKVTARDAWGSESVSTVRHFAVSADSDPPAITLDSPADGALTNATHMPLQVTVSDASPPVTLWFYGDQTADPTTLVHVAEGLGDPTTLTYDWTARPMSPDATHNMGLWHLDEHAGTSTLDAGSFGNHGTFFGDPAWVTGRFGYAIDLDGTDDYVEMPDHSSLDIDSATGALTMEAWVYPRVSGGDEVWRTILAKKAMGGVGVNYQMGLDKTTGNLLFFSGRYPEIWISSIHVPVNEWSYVAITLEAAEGRLRFYRNGVAQDSTAAGSAWFGPAHNGALHVGVSGAVAECFNGVIDEVRLTGRVLTAAEIAAHHRLDDGVYRWKVTAADAYAQTDTEGPLSFTVDAQAPGVPALIQPASMSVIADNTPQFMWSKTTGTGGIYTLQYAANSNFTAGLVTHTNLTDTALTVAAGSELADGVWYWHVQARDLAGNWSGYQATPFSFTVHTAVDSDPPEITLLDPPDLSTVYENHAELSASVSDPSSPVMVWFYGGTSPGNLHLYDALTGLSSPSTVHYDWSGSVLEAELPYTMGLWHFDENAGTAVTDQSGNGNHATFAGSPDWTAAGKFGYALDLDGVSDYLTVPDAASLDIDSATGKLSIEAWIRPDAVGGGDWKKILSKRQFGGELTNYEMVLNDVTGTLTFYNGRMPQIYVSTVYVPPGQWSYVAVTLDAAEGMLRFYRNGRKLDSIPGAVFGGANNYPLTIGTGSATAHCVDGLLDEVRLTRRVLSPWEILGNYYLDSGQYFWRVVAQDSLGNRDTSETWSFFAEPPPVDRDAPEITLLAPANGSWTMDPFADLSALVSDASPTLARIYGSMNPDPQELLYSEGGLVGAQMLDYHWSGRPFVTEPGVTAGLWHLDEGTGTTTADVSGHTLTGTLVSGPTWATSGRFGAALSFDGTNDYVNVPHNANLNVDSATGALTMEAWVYPDVSGGDDIWRTILSKSNMGSAVVNYRMSLDRVTGNLLFYSGRYPEIWISSVHVPAGEWSYVAVSLSAAEGKLRFYRNGVALDSTASGSAWFGPAHTSEFHIGVSMATAECFDGLIDEVRLTRRVLTPAEIAAHMALHDGVYYWRVTAADSMGNAATAGPWSFLVNTAPAPPIPELRLPAHLALLTDATPQMVWTATAGSGGHYTLEYALDAGFSSGKVTVSGLTDSVYTPPSALADNTYYWHVQATSSLGTPSGYQTPYAFTLDTQAPAVPTLRLPVHLALLTDNTPTLMWSRENGGLYTLQYSQNPGFALGVVTQSGLSDTTYTVPGGMQLSDGVWYWRVQATDQAGNASGYQLLPYSFTVDTQAPAVPVLLTPADLALITDNTPTFTWTATAGTGGTYRLQVDVTPLFTTAVTISGITSNAYTMPVPMGDGDYYWHVEAVDLAAHHSGFQATPFEFTLDAGMPSAPLLLTPPHNSFTCDATPIFTWTPSVVLALTPAVRDATALAAVGAVASTYTLQMSLDSTFTQPTTVAGLVETFYSPQYPLDQTVCYWRVQALDPAGNPSGYQASPFALWFFRAGDLDLSTTVTSADVIRLVNFVFKGGSDPLPCEAAGDVNCDVKITSADIIRLVNFVFKGGEPPCDLGALITAGDWTCP